MFSLKYNLSSFSHQYFYFPAFRIKSLFIVLVCFTESGVRINMAFNNLTRTKCTPGFCTSSLCCRFLLISVLKKIQTRFANDFLCFYNAGAHYLIHHYVKVEPRAKRDPQDENLNVKYLISSRFFFKKTDKYVL